MLAASSGQQTAPVLRRFSLEEMRTIAEAVLENPHASPSELGRQLDRDKASVHHVIKKLGDAGGWYTRIVWKICQRCGEPLATSGSANGIGPAKYHPRCKVPVNTPSPTDTPVNNLGEYGVGDESGPFLATGELDATNEDAPQRWPDLENFRPAVYYLMEVEWTDH